LNEEKKAGWRIGSWGEALTETKLNKDGVGGGRKGACDKMGSGDRGGFRKREGQRKGVRELHKSVEGSD